MKTLFDLIRDYKRLASISRVHGLRINELFVVAYLINNNFGPIKHTDIRSFEKDITDNSDEKRLVKGINSELGTFTNEIQRARRAGLIDYQHRKNDFRSKYMGYTPKGLQVYKEILREYQRRI